MNNLKTLIKISDIRKLKQGEEFLTSSRSRARRVRGGYIIINQVGSPLHKIAGIKK